MSEDSEKGQLIKNLSAATPIDPDREPHLNYTTSIEDVAELAEEQMLWQDMTLDGYLDLMEERIKEGELRGVNPKEAVEKLRSKLTEKRFEILKNVQLSYISERILRNSIADQHDADNQCGSRNAIRDSKVNLT